MSFSKRKKAYAPIAKLGVRRKEEVWGLLPQKIFRNNGLSLVKNASLNNKLVVGDKEFDSSWQPFIRHRT